MINPQGRVEHATLPSHGWKCRSCACANADEPVCVRPSGILCTWLSVGKRMRPPKEMHTRIPGRNRIAPCGPHGSDYLPRDSSFPPSSDGSLRGCSGEQAWTRSARRGSTRIPSLSCTGCLARSNTGRHRPPTPGRWALASELSLLPRAGSPGMVHISRPTRR